MYDNKVRNAPHLAMAALLAGMLAVLPACGGAGGAGDANATSDVTETETTGEDLTVKETEGTATKSAGDDLRSDDTQLVFQDDTGTSKTVFKHDGDTITGMLTYINYGDVQTAQAAAKQLADDDSAKVYADGTYVVFEYDANNYDDLTLEEIQANYSHLKQI